MSSEEVDINDIITLTFGYFDEMAKKLDDIPLKAELKTNALLKLLSDKEADIFNESDKFYAALNDLSEEIGHSLHTVLEIELRQKGILQEFNQTIQSKATNPTPLQPITIQTSSPQQLGVFSGGWHYLTEKAKAKTSLEAIKLQLQNQPQISTSRQVIDILDFGRQQIPEYINKTIKYYEQCLAHLRVFSDIPRTKAIFQSNLREHLNKLAAIIRAFCRTIVEYRKEMFGERKRDIAKAVISLKMAEASALQQQRLPPLSVDPMAEKMRRE